MRVEPFPECCGGAVFVGFYGTRNRFEPTDKELTPESSLTTPEQKAEWVETVRVFIDQRIKDGLARDARTVTLPHPRYGPRTIGFYQATLNDEQREMFHDMLIDLGFRVVASRVLNVRYGSKMTVYMYVTHGEENG